MRTYLFLGFSAGFALLAAAACSSDVTQCADGDACVGSAASSSSASSSESSASSTSSSASATASSSSSSTGGGGAGGGGLGGAGPNDVSGKLVATHVTDTGDIASFDDTSASVSALVPDGMGGYTTIPGEVDGAGNF